MVQKGHKDVIEEYGKWFEGISEKFRQPGLSVSLVYKPEGEEGEEEWVERQWQSGIADAKGKKWDEHTIFSIASISKHFTTIAVGLLIHDGHVLPNGKKLVWDTLVKDVFEGWKPKDQILRDECTLADLAAMRSGMPGHDNAYGDISGEEMLARFTNLDISTGIRKTFQYANFGFALLGYLIEHLTGKTLPEFCEERLFKPLGMTSTSNCHGKDRIKAIESGHMADGHQAVLDITKAVEAWKTIGEDVEHYKDNLPDDLFGEKIRAYRFWDRDFKKLPPGQGHILSTPSDMTKWLRELLDPQVIPKSVIEGITKPYTVASSNGNPPNPEEGFPIYALGLQIFSYRGITAWTHGGGTPGYKSYMIVLPAKKLGVVVTCNHEFFGGSIVKALANRLIDQLLGFEYVPWIHRGIGDWLGFLGYVDPENLPPKSPRPPLDPTIVRGKYSHPGYAEVDLKPLVESGIYDKWSETLISSPIPVTDADVWVSPRDSIFGHYLIFTHIDGPRYRWSTCARFPSVEEGKEGREDDIVWPWIGGVAVFTERGIGMFGHYDSRGDIDRPKKPTEEDVEKNCEVWFTKV